MIDNLNTLNKLIDSDDSEEYIDFTVFFSIINFSGSRTALVFSYNPSKER